MGTNGFLDASGVFYSYWWGVALNAVHAGVNVFGHEDRLFQLLSVEAATDLPLPATSESGYLKQLPHSIPAKI